MIVTVDGQRVSEPGPARETLQVLLDEVRAAHLNERLIVSVAINGRRLDDAELNAGLEQPIADDAQIDLESGEPVALVQNILRGLAGEFGAAGGQFGELADRLSSGDATAAFREVGVFVGLWQTSFRALVQGGELLKRDLMEYECAGDTMKAGLADLVEKLSELRGALEARDSVLLADLVRYELPPLAQAWSAMLSNLAEQIGGSRTGE